MLVKLSICLLAVFSEILAFSKDEYCGIICEVNYELFNHTMCIYDGVSDACSPNGQFGVDDDYKAQIVAIHNKLRNKVASGRESRGLTGPQPEASNMKKLVWDDEVARVAQRSADQCVFKHDKCIKDPRFDVGQNIGISFDSPTCGKPELESTILRWYNEVDIYSVSSIRDWNVGHYEQIVWAETEVIGCGYRTYSDITNPCNKLFVCNYGPAGNIDGQMPYQLGPARSACRDSPVDPEYPALC